jgi:hypothetical protein
MSKYTKAARSDAEIELQQRCAARMRATGRYVYVDAKNHVLSLDPTLAAKIEQLEKRKLPR